ncbi:MAG: cysteine desulfurase family protein [Rhizomicrobium sp.]
MAYCDHNATAPLRPEAREALERALAVTGNPSSVHAHGRAARAMVEGARAAVGSLVKAEADRVIFTSGATEANSLALWGAIEGAAEAGEAVTRLIVSAIEHESVLNNGRLVAGWLGLGLEIVPVTSEGVVDTATLASLLSGDHGRALVAMMAANNETGVIQPIADVSCLCRERNALLLVDAVAAAGKTPLDAGLCDYMSLSAHKLGAPQGVGGLIVGKNAPLRPQLLGGGQQQGLRAGTENLSGIAAFGAAARAVLEGVEEVRRVAFLRDAFEAKLHAALPQAAIAGAGAPRVGNTSSVVLKALSSENVLIALDLDGVMVSSGSACSSGKIAPSHVLAAMGVGEDRAAIRVSFGWNSVAADADQVVASLVKFCARADAREAA